MREGSLDAPVRHPLGWRDADFFDPAKLEAETRRVFDICHGCRRCFNLCDSFPRLFDAIDASATGELDEVPSSAFGAVVAACTLCDMCFMTKCPYVPPHEFNLDFPSLMVRHRAVEFSRGKGNWASRQLALTDRNGKLGGWLAPLVNWAGAVGNRLTRPLLEWLAGIHRAAALPRFHRQTLLARAGAAPKPVAPAPGGEAALNEKVGAPGKGRKAAIFATCYGNFNDPAIGEAALKVLALNGVETEVVYPGCCGMPHYEQGDLAAVAASAQRVAQAFAPYIDRGYDVIALVPSCALMLKFEFARVAPDDAAVKRLAEATFDITEYIVDLARKGGLAGGMRPIEGGISVHIACHSRAQNMGAKALDMLRLIPGAKLVPIERCSGHGGSWGVLSENFEVAMKVGAPVAKAAVEQATAYVASECPLAGAHIIQGMQRLGPGPGPGPERAYHPIELLAKAYDLRA
jgi:glycerol-3-phosphate dehydrogenase subunit C